MRYSHHMNKQLTFLLSLTLLFLVGCKTVGVNDNQSKDYTEEVRLHRLSAEQGNVKGQINLGVMYFNGHGVHQDYKEAVRLFRLSAEQGLAEAQSNLGFMYEIGHGVQQDYKEAVKWFRLSAEQGNEKGQINLGVMYDKGQGVPQDYVLAHMWFSLASTKGIKKAIEKRNSAESKMSPAQIAKAQEMVRNWKPTKK